MKNKFYLYIVFIIMILSSFNVRAEGEALLTNIKVNGVECTCTGYDCSVSLEASNATITYDLKDESAKVDRLSGFNVDLLSEVTTIKITVTNTVNDDKIENEYNISITKLEKQNDLSLKSLKVNGASMKVSSDIISYNYDCEYDTQKIVLDVVPNDSKAKVIKQDEYYFEEDAKTLSANFYIQSSDGEKLEYGVIATRKEKPNTTLKSIKLDYGTVPFDPKVTEYELTVPHNINKLKVDVEASNEKANVEIQNDDLIVGENEIIITVTNEKSKTEYKIHVTREEDIDKSVANLASITIDEYKKFDFQENVLEYKLNFNEIPSKLTIHAKSKNEDSTISILQNENLTDGSKVIVKNELNESKIAREYIIEIHKITVKESNKKLILVCIIILIITMVVLLYLDINSKKKEKKLYLKKVFDLRKKVEKLKKEGKIIPTRNKKKVKKSKAQKEEDELEII